ncbi:type II secretion system major pseudopilin GspG [Lysobacter sp. CCNWLW3]|uniref:type II secretion system major pseudopilin GspG n=1 Tax=unclassified Lysobacter TaxID=2635362 RepID=UPI002FD79D3F
MRNPRSLRRPSAALQRGMSLIEIIIVIVLIGAVMTVVGAKVFGANDNAKFKLAKTQVQTLAGKVESFQMDTGRLPSSLDELVKAPSDASGWLGPYVKDVDLKDPWGHPVEYRSPGEGRDFDVVILGKDGKPGGTSVDGDVKYE